MVKKDRFVILNKTNKIDNMLPPLYQTHLENQLEPSELLLFNILINLLQNLKQISLEKIATALLLPVLFESRRKKIQRLLSLLSLNLKTL